MAGKVEGEGWWVGNVEGGCEGGAAVRVRAARVRRRVRFPHLSEV